MAIHDKGNDFWVEQDTALWATTPVASQASPSIDLKRVSGKPFAGSKPMDIEILINKTFVGATSTTQFILEDSADDITFAVVLNGTGQEVQTEAIPVAVLVEGYQPAMPYHANLVVRRYMRLRAAVATANLSDGTVTAGLVCKRQTAMV